MESSAIKTAIGACVAIVALPLVVMVMFLSVDGDNDGNDDYAMAAAYSTLVGGALRPDAPVPPQYVPWLIRAGSICRDIAPALLAAQIDQESSWNPNADTYNPPERGGNAQGLAQFQAATWKTWGGDYNGNGVNSPFDPEDAIMAQGMLMCDLVKWARQGIADKSLTGDVIDLALAGYNCGRGCVQSAGGVPSAGQAHDYPQLIRAKIPKYAATPVVTSGGWALPLAKGTYAIGSGYGPRGGAFHYGVDLMANKGVPIYATAAGTVIVSTCNASTGNCDVDGSAWVSGCGWYVQLRHAGGLYTTYCHMVRRPYVSVGQTVAAGQPLGHVGSSGNSSGPHLHFEVHVNNPANAGAIEPISFLRSAGLNP